MIRLYVPGTELREGGDVVLTGDRHHYLTRVLRIRPGADVELFNGDGSVYRGPVADVSREDVRLGPLVAAPALSPSPVHVTLVAAVLKGARLETVVQKATELGVASIRLALTERCDAGAPSAARLRRLQTIAVEAAEQCGRAEVPSVHAAVSLPEALDAAGMAPLRLLLWERARHRSLIEAFDGAGTAADVVLVVGPEGGLSEAEVDRCRARGYATFGLGPRILRAETAPLVALAVLQSALGDLAPRRLV